MSNTTPPTVAEKTPTRNSPFQHLINLIVGALIGIAETLPGISGGTVALVTGIYERAVRNGDALLHLFRMLLTNRSEVKGAAKKVEWVFLGTVGVGMVVAVLSVVNITHAFVENSPETARALFLGMVFTSLFVPLKAIDRADLATKRVPAIGLFFLATIGVFLLTGMTSAEKTDPSMVVVYCAAAIAICALVLPGISGSFILLALGLYQPIMGAIAAFDIKVMLVFIAGAITGLALFIKLLKYMMETHHTLTMVAMAGFMLGSLRALWPWQDANANLLPPGDNLLWIIFVFFIGVVAAGAIMILERYTEK